MGAASGHSIVQSVARLHAVCHERGVPTVAVAPTQGPGPKCRALRQQLADLLAAWAGPMAGVLDFLDVEDLLPRPCGKDGKANQPSAAAHWERDDLHFSAAGSLALGRRLAPHASAWLRAAAGRTGRTHVGAAGAASTLPAK